jgi:thymidylate synthase (FAD)
MEFEPITRPSVPALDAILGQPFKCLDHGFVRLIDYMGDDAAIVQAARVSYGKGTKTANDDRGLIDYLMRHQHTTPFEMCQIKLHCKMPIFVARQWIRHRMSSVNEISGRYSILKNEFYVPELEDIQPQSKTNKQGRAGELDPNKANIWRSDYNRACSEAFSLYNWATEKDIDVARETARMNLPLSTYTEWYWKTDLKNLFHFLALRIDGHAQKEIRVYGEAIADIVKLWVPMAHAAWLEHQVGASTFSASAMNALRLMLSGDAEMNADKILSACGVKGREADDVIAAIFK